MAKYESDPNSKTPEQKEFEQKSSDFLRIDNAIAQTKLIPKLHNLFSKKGIEETYAVLDGYEIATGFPITVFTRSIVLVFTENEEKIASEWNNVEIYPGLLVSDIQGFGTRTLEIQIGLNGENMRKFVERGGIDIDNEEAKYDTNPPWWNYPYPVFDLTKPHNLSPDENYFGKQDLLKGNGLSLECFLWNGANSDDTPSFVFEQEKKKKIIKDPFEEEKEMIEKGIKKIQEVIEKYLG